MDYLKRGHAHDGLSVAVVHVLGHIAIVDALDEGVEHAEGHVAISLVAGGGIKLGGVAGDGQYVSVDA